jgi:hypothetical protein
MNDNNPFKFALMLIAIGVALCAALGVGGAIIFNSFRAIACD